MSNETEDFEQTYEALEKENFPDGKRIKFIAELGVSSDIEGHFRLMIILGYFEPPVRVFGATVPEKGSHEFRCSRATFVPCL